MLLRFIIFGSLGCLMEVFWTGMHSLIKKDYTLSANTSIWMFFIYGLAVFLEPICDMLMKYPVYLRGGVYVVCIFSIEYLTGSFLKSAKLCPWDYSHSKYNVAGIIRLDYAPAWFVAGLLFERIHLLLV